MPDILLIQPPIRDFYLTVKRTIPYGLACIASELRRSGFSVEISDALATKKSRDIPFPQEMTFLESYYAAKDVSPFALFHGFRHFGHSFEHIGNIAKASDAFLVGISSLFTAYSNEALETAEIV
ncbi:MAG: radical SAM protein, partial [Desulfobacteraceae bacterium]|nr:radical SAM protein [Desulfobacteraceae bacterium]